MPLIPLELIDENGHNIRRTPATAEQDEQLVQSIRTLGVLQPVLLREDERAGRYHVVVGHRRVRCARTAGLDDIPGEVLTHNDKARYAASQAAENIVRVPMDPVDQWRAIVALQASGYTLEAAGQALGIAERRTRQLDKLGRLAPEVLDLIVGKRLPDEKELGAIASAPLETQRALLKQNGGAYDTISYIARACAQVRIPRAWAIFEIETAGIVFDEDLFAEPGTDGQFTTSDVPGFIECQKKALFAAVDARVKRGERIVLTKWTKGGIKLPKGWQRSYDAIKKKYPAKGRLSLFTCVRDDGYNIGRIEELAAFDAAAEVKAVAKANKVGKPAATECPDVSVGDGDGDGDDDDDDDKNEFDAEASLATAMETAAETSGPALTKRGQTMLAAIKTDALRDRLDEISDSDALDLDLAFLCSALILALSGTNVAINGSDNRWGNVSFKDLQAQIVSPAGTFIPLTESEVARLTAAALSRIVRVSDPATAIGSGVVAEWIGAAIAAEARLPRFDGQEFLACMGRDALQAVAEQHGRGGLKTAKGLRETLTGSLPEWRPASFGAPGPLAVTTSKVITPEEEEAA